MHLIIVRHGKAHKDSATGRDEDRTLTGRGRRQAEWLGQHLNAKGPSPRVIVTSPLARAAETAGLIHEHLKIELCTDPRLGTDTSIEAVMELIAEQKDECVMVVGHNPTLSVVAGALTAHGAKKTGELRTGEAIVLKFKGGAGPGRGEVEATLRLDEDD